MRSAACTPPPASARWPASVAATAAAFGRRKRILASSAVSALALDLGLEALEALLHELGHGLHGRLVVQVLGREIAGVGAVEAADPGHLAAVAGRGDGDGRRVEADRERLHVLRREAVAVAHILVVVLIEAFDEFAGLERDGAGCAGLVAAARRDLGDGGVPAHVAELLEGGPDLGGRGCDGDLLLGLL